MYNNNLFHTVSQIHTDTLSDANVLDECRALWVLRALNLDIYIYIYIQRIRDTSKIELLYSWLTLGHTSPAQVGRNNCRFQI